jgi:hypothetical protein
VRRNKTQGCISRQGLEEEKTKNKKTQKQNKTEQKKTAEDFNCSVALR